LVRHIVYKNCNYCIESKHVDWPGFIVSAMLHFNLFCWFNKESEIKWGGEGAI